MTIENPSTSVLRSALLTFFDADARELPWRNTTDPYGIWVSEIMLQQTRVQTVIPYYQRWMKRFPTVVELADAPLESVLESWAGLGYYSRARNLHRAATVVRENHGGELPADLVALRALPGIGEYTAGAVASIAFGTPAPAVDGNVRRVLSRIFDIEKPTTATLRATASDVVDPTRPGDFNQALMELGATVCLPRTPECGRCPVVSECRAFARGTIGLRPPKRAKKTVPIESHTVAVVRFRLRGDTWTLLRRRPPTGLLAGMLEFPSVLQCTDAVRQLGTEILPLADINGVKPRSLEALHHRFSHLAATYHPLVFDLPEEPSLVGAVGESHWMPLAWTELGAAALTAAQRRIAIAAEELVPIWRML